MVDVDKMQGCTCPKCGKVYATCDFANVNLGVGAQVNLTCESNHKWSEFYTLSYQGFWWDGKLYDSFGCDKHKETDGGNTDEIKI